MSDMKKLIIYIEEEIKNIKKSILELKQQQVDEILEKAILIIKESIVDYKKILQITDEELESLKSICGDHIIYNIKAYKSFISKSSIHFTDSSKQKLESFCNVVLDKYEEYKNINSNDNEDIENLNHNLDKLKSLRYKISDSFELKPSDIDLIIAILNKNNITPEEIIDYIIDISGKFMTKLQQHNLEPEDFIQEKISLEDIIELFKSYNYDFNVFNKRQQNEILTKGNLNNIKEILDVLTNENINLNTPFNSKTILSGRSNQLCEIFVHSTPELVFKIIDTAKSKIKLYNGENLNFVLLIERPGIFIAKRRHSKNQNEGPGGFEGDSICGCHEDFLNNIDLIYDKYKEVYGTDKGFDQLFKKAKLKCVFETSHKKIKNIVSTLELYGFETKDYLRALSSFNSTTHADVLDVAIELDCYRYVKDNPTKLTRNVNSELYTQLAIARNLCHLSDDMLFNTKKRSENNESYIDLKESELNYIIDSNGLVFEKFRIEDNYDEEHVGLFKEVEEKILSNDSVSFELALKDLQQDDSILNKLEKYVYFNDPMVYEINGIRISKNKVLRLYHILKLNNYLITSDFMIYIMSRNSYLTQEQFERLSSGIVEIIEQGEKTV